MSNGITYDETAPEIASVSLQQTVDNETGPTGYLPVLTGLRALINAREDVGIITLYKAAPGILDSNNNWTDSNFQEGESSNGTVELEDPDPQSITAGEDILAIRGICENNSLQVREGYSAGAIYTPMGLTIENVTGYVSDNIVQAAWDGITPTAPVKKYKVILKNIEEVSGFPLEDEPWTDTGLTGSVALPADELAEGQYSVYVTGEDYAGYKNNGTSNLIVIDHTPPELSVNIPLQTVSSVLEFSATAIENLSGIEEYSYAVGIENNPELYSDGLVSLFHHSPTLTNHRIDLSALPVNIPDQSQFTLSVKVKNRAGLWSDAVVNNGIIFDRQQPSTPLIEIENYSGKGQYTVYSTRITGVAVNSQSPGAGITRYRSVVIAEEDRDLYTNSGLAGFYEESLGLSEKIFVRENLTVLTPTGEPMSETQRYLVAVQTGSAAGIWSEVGFSAPVIYDSEGPVITYSEETTLIINDNTVSGSTITADDPVFINFSVNDDTGDKVTVDFFLSLDGKRTELGDRVIGRTEYNTEIPYRINLPEYALEFGQYSLMAKLTDGSGHEVEAVTINTILVNRLPEVKLNNIVVNRWEWAFFMDELIIVDKETGFYSPDSKALQESFKYEWDFNDDGITDLLFDPNIPGAVWQEPTQYYDEINKEGHRITLTLTDGHGKSVTVESLVYVLNTSSGSLSGDEDWNDDHAITGDITIPEGITLTISPDVRVLVTGKYLVTVHGTLNMGNNSLMKYRNEIGKYRDDWWKGIIVENGGTVNLNGAIIQQAMKAFTINETPGEPDTTAIITNCTFDYNHIGLHLFGKNQLIRNTNLTRNNRYAIKEDVGGQAVVENCVFTENSYDYYDEERTVIFEYSGNEE